MTDPGRWNSLFNALPSGVDALREVAQGLVLHEHFAPAYGVMLSDADRATVHLRRVESLLSLIFNLPSRGTSCLCRSLGVPAGHDTATA